MKNSKRLIIAFLVLAMAFAFGACAPAPASDSTTQDQGQTTVNPDEVIEISWSIAWGPSSIVNTYLAPWFVEEIEKRTNGRVKITVFNGGELLDIPGTYEGILNGIADMGTSRIGSTPGRFPIMSAFEMPGFQFNNNYAVNLTYNEMFEKYSPPDLQDTKLLWIDSAGAPVMFTKMPVHKLEDIAGKQIRAEGMTAEAVLALGATPVSFTMNDAYLALQNNVADGIFDMFGGLDVNKIGEVTEYMVLVRGVSPAVCFFNTMNLDKWNSLPPDIQEIFMEVSREAAERDAELVWANENVGLQFGYDHGMQAMLLDEGENERWMEKVSVVRQKWIDAGDASFDRAAFMKDFDATIKKYNEQFPQKWPELLEELYPDISVN